MEAIETSEFDKIELILNGTLLQEVTSDDTIIVTVKDQHEHNTPLEARVYRDHMMSIKLALESKHNCQVILVPKDTEITVLKFNKDK